MDNAWDISQQGQQDVEPKVHTKANLQEHAHRGQEDRQQNANDVEAFDARATFDVGGSAGNGHGFIPPWTGVRATCPPGVNARVMEAENR